MPKISKIRIANLYYDDRKKFVADEIYNLLSDKNTTATHTLFSLQNGGGKSVLIQMLMQPIAPNTSIGKRRMIDYLPERNDHFFVLIEWIRENPNDRLLTGVAYRRVMPRQSSKASDDYERINYYTFFSAYTPAVDGRSVINDLELTYKKNGKSFVQAYDYVREYAKANPSSHLQCFSSDRSEEWRKKLQDYGINQGVMRLQADINKREGDLGELFDDCRTSDQLINNFFIPHISATLSDSAKEKEDKLSKVANECVHTVIERKEALKELDELKSLHKMLLPTATEAADALIQSHEAYVTTMERLLSFEKAIGNDIAQKETLIVQKLEELEQLEEQSKRIHYEETSEAYYIAQKALQAVAQALTTLNSEKENLEQAKKVTKQQLDILRCAKVYGELRETKAGLGALTASIKEKEASMETDSELAKLEYSLFIKVNQAYEAASLKLGDETARFDEQKSALEQQLREMEQYQRDKELAHDDCTRRERDVKSAQKEVDKLLRQLGMPRERVQDNPQEKIESKKRQIEETLQSLEAQQEESIRRQEEIKEKLATLRDAIPSLTKEQVQLDQTIKTLENEKCQFAVYDDQVIKVCRRYFIDINERFSTALYQGLLREKEKQDAQEYMLKKDIERVNEELRAIENKSLHVHHSVLSFFKDEGIRYVTCEDYLESQKSKGLLENKDIIRLLEKTPALAYGVILDEDNKKRALAQRPEWLPMAVPLFASGDLAKLLQGESLEGSQLLACYSKKYFADTNTFLEQCHGELAEKEAALRRAQEENKRLLDDLALLQQKSTAFTYTKEWQYAQSEKIEATNRDLAEVNLTLSLYKEDISQQEIEQQRLRQKQEQMAKSQQEAERTLNLVHQSLGRLDTEVQAKKGYDAALAREEEATAHYQKACQKKDELALAVVELQKQVEVLKEQLDELMQKREQYKEVPQTTLRDEEWQILDMEYAKLKAGMDKDLQVLKEQAQKLALEKHDLEQQVARYHLDEGVYKDVRWTLEEEVEKEEKAQTLEDDYNAVLEKVSAKSEENGKCQSRLESVHKQLDVFHPEGAPLAESEIAGDYSARRETIGQHKNACEDMLAQARKRKAELEKVSAGIDGAIGERYTLDYYEDIAIDEDAYEQFKRYEKEKRAHQKSYKEQKEKLVQLLQDISGAHNLVQSTIVKQGTLKLNDCALRMADEQKTPIEVKATISACIDALERTLAIEGEKNQLLEEMKLRIKERCAYRAEAIYEKLQKIEEESRIIDGGVRRKMIKTDMPRIGKDNAQEATNRVQHYVDDELETLIRDITQTEEKMDNKEITRRVERMIDNGILLRKYIGKDIIGVQCYKVEKEGGRYRSWKDTREKNSGAEGYVAYLSITLALLHYKSNSESEFMSNVNGQNVLLLDNPFAKSTSAHVVNKMFQMADHYNTQLVCFSAAEESQITSNFAVINRLRLEKIPNNDLERLAQETLSEEETLTHGSMREEQQTMFDW